MLGSALRGSALLRGKPAAAIATGLFVLAGLMLSPASAATAAKGPVLLRDVKASQDDIPLKKVTFPVDASHPQPDTQIEPSIAVNPADPLNAVAVFQEDRVDAGGDAGNGYTATLDGGKTWRHGFLPGLTRVTGGPFDRASDAVVTFGADPAHKGHYLVYANSLVFNDGTGPGGDTSQSGMAINVSKDGGRTWSKAIVLEQDGLAGLNDKNWLVADNGVGVGHTTGRVYVVWDRIAPMVYTYCDKNCDKLANWASINNGTFYPFDVTAGIGSIPLVMPDGSLGVVFESDFVGTPSIPSSPTDQPEFAAPGSQLMYAEAPGAGAVVWPAPLPFAQAAVGIAANNNRNVVEQRAGTLPAAAINAKTGQVYVAWEDGRFRTDGLNDIVFSTSTNGVTWSSPKRVDPGPTGNHVNHWNAMVDVDSHGGVHIGYRQRLEKKGSPTGRSATGLSPHISTYYQESTDQGATWSHPLKVNTVSTDVGYAAFSRGGAFLGDYNQLATASNGTTYLVHNEALAKHAGEKCNCSFTSGNGHQHQYTYVAVIGHAGSSGSGGSGSGGSGNGSGGTGTSRGSGGSGGLANSGLSSSLPLAGLGLLFAAAALRRRRHPAG
ncbi:MAG: hypothetical protein QOF18_622 [Frankiaceae bacterium]|nr:hypothetical protein [Frankiaceae bacterium]